MASGWLKMRMDLQSHPKVVRILSAMRLKDGATQTDKFRVIGGLHAVWSVFDTHSEDGRLYGYTPETLDHVIGWEGFAEAMMLVDWLTFDGSETIEMPRFSEHNGQSAKRRAEDQKRKRDARSEKKDVRNLSENDADKKRTREEKRREEVNIEAYASVPGDSLRSTPDDPEEVGEQSRSAPCPAESIVDLYHRHMPDNPKCVVLNDARRRAIRSRWKEAARLTCAPFGYSTRADGLKAWGEFFAVCAASDFLTGKARPQKGKPPFIADIDFLMSPSGFAKTLENKYHREAA